MELMQFILSNLCIGSFDPTIIGETFLKVAWASMAAVDDIVCGVAS